MTNLATTNSIFRIEARRGGGKWNPFRLTLSNLAMMYYIDKKEKQKSIFFLLEIVQITKTIQVNKGILEKKNRKKDEKTYENVKVVKP